MGGQKHIFGGKCPPCPLWRRHWGLVNYLGIKGIAQYSGPSRVWTHNLQIMQRMSKVPNSAGTQEPVLPVNLLEEPNLVLVDSDTSTCWFQQVLAVGCKFESLTFYCHTTDVLSRKRLTSYGYQNEMLFSSVNIMWYSWRSFCQRYWFWFIENDSVNLILYVLYCFKLYQIAMFFGPISPILRQRDQ